MEWGVHPLSRHTQKSQQPQLLNMNKVQRLPYGNERLKNVRREAEE